VNRGYRHNHSMVSSARTLAAPNSGWEGPGELQFPPLGLNGGGHHRTGNDHEICRHQPPVKTPIWSKGQDSFDINKYRNSPYLPALQKVTAYMQHLDSIGLPPEKVAEVVYDALTLPNSKVRYQVAPDPMRHLMTAALPKRMVDKIIAKRVGLMPPA
jgi:hypothetical protein